MAYQQIEQAIQIAYIKWIRMNEKREPRFKLLFAVPNGGVRDRRTAGLLKMEGVLAGVPDLVLPVRTYNSTGLMQELKRPKTPFSQRGELTQSQRDYHELVRAQGWQVDVCYSLEEAIASITNYLQADA